VNGNLFFLSRTSLEQIEEMAAERLISLEDDLIRSLIDSKGLSYGDIELPREERILSFADDEQRGLNAWIAENEPDDYIKRVQTFQTDVQESGLI